MGFAHALELLHAVAQLAHAPSNAQTQLSKDTLETQPLPHLQQRLQQSLRGVVLVAAASVVLPLAALCFMPMLGSPFAFPGVIAFALLSAVLLSAALAQLLVRLVMLPAPRPFLPDRTSIYGVAQTLLCVAFDVCARIYQEPQLVVLLALCVFHSWLWKSMLYVIMTGASDDDGASVRAHFSMFAATAGAVAFASLLGFEVSITHDPFVLDPRAALQTALQRDAVRAVRRGIIAWSLAHALLVVTQHDESLLSLRLSRAVFHIASSVTESFVALSAASMARILLFRATPKALESAVTDGSLWDALARTRTIASSVSGGGFAIRDLFTGAIQVDAQAATPLSEQYVAALRVRMDRALKQIATRRIGASSSDAGEHVEALDTLFALSNARLVTQFDAAARRALFASEPRWRALLQRTTGELDSFTLALRLLNAVPERKHEGDEKLAASLDKSVFATLTFVGARADTHPLLLLDAYPHLANVRIARGAIASRIQFAVEAAAQFAVRRFLIEEARRRVFVRTRVVFAAQELLSHVVSASRTEDAQGVVQHAVPAVVASLVACRQALDSYLETCLKHGIATDVYVKEADALARGIDKGIYRITDAFYSELAAFAFPSEVKSALEAYTSFRA